MKTYPAVESPTVPSGTNFVLAFLFVFLFLFQYFYLPLVLLEESLWWGALVPLLALATPPFWALAHEAVHGVFHTDKRVNRLAGRSFGVLFGSPFLFLRFGHLMHHKFNRQPVDNTDLYDPAATGRAGAFAAYYFKVLGGLYVLELLIPLAFFLPRKGTERVLNLVLDRDEASFNKVRALAREQLLGEKGRREMQRDGLLVFLLLGASAWAYGEQAWMLAGMLLLRGFFISFLDNVYHYGTGVTRPDFSYNLELPWWMSRAMLHFNYHHVHHQHPQLPWTGLPGRFREEGNRFDGPYFPILFRQLKGPIPCDATA